MKPLHIFLIIVGTIVFLMLGCFLFFGVCIGLSPLQDAMKEVERLYAHRVWAGLVGIFFLSIGYIGVKILVKKPIKQDIFVVNSDYGRTSISIIAVEDLVKKTLKKYEQIKKYKERISIHNGVLELRISLTIWSGQAANEVVEFVHSDLLKKLKNFVGLTSDNLSIEIKVEKVVEKK